MIRVKGIWEIVTLGDILSSVIGNSGVVIRKKPPEARIRAQISFRRLIFLLVHILRLSAGSSDFA